MLHLYWQVWFRPEWGSSEEVQETLESQPICCPQSLFQRLELGRLVGKQRHLSAF